MLSQKQDSIYKALELSIQELDLNEDVLCSNNSDADISNKNLITTCNESQVEQKSPQILHNNESLDEENLNGFENQVSQEKSEEKLIENLVHFDSPLIKQSKDTMASTKNDVKLTLNSPKHQTEMIQFIDGIAPLPPDKSLTNHVCIDDLPVPSPKKDFHTLLEEKLKDCENVPNAKVNMNSGNKTKKPFLKKGEGLSRFRLNRPLYLPITKSRARSKSLSNNIQSNSKHSKNESKNNTVQSSKMQLPKNAHCASSTQKHLSLKNIPLPKHKLRCKSDSNTSDVQLEKYINEIKNTIELNTSDFQFGTQEESEEVRIFELLEEKAENSSFCSTSSAAIAFLQQSTPFKIKKGKCKIEDDTVNAKQNHNDQSALKSNQAYKYRILNKSTDSYCDLHSFINKKITQNNMHKNTNVSQDTNEDNKPEPVHDIENNNELDVSLHVRFSEYNEYKTIGLTDTSSISTESLVTRTFSDEKVWSDSSTPETSNIEISSMPFKIQEGVICNAQTSDFKYNTDTHQNIFHKDDSEFSDQSTDNEQSTIHNYSQSNSVSIDTSNDIDKPIQCMDEHDGRKLGNNYTDEGIIEVAKSEETSQETNETVFTSDLLKSRLLELEREINIFRKENTALSAQRKKLQEDHRNLHKEYAEKEKSLEENRKQIENRLQDERKKLAREKAALESRMRDSQEKAQQSKLERQEIQYLKEEIDRLKEDIYVKESRWNAAQSRQKCQMRILKMENSKLKQEVERLQNLKKSNSKNKGKLGSFSNTKAIHQINKQINMQLKESKKSNDIPLEDNNKKWESINKTESMMRTKNMEENEHNCNSNIDVTKEKLQKSQTNIVNIAKKRSLYENLIKEATSDMMDNHEQFSTSDNFRELKSDLNNRFKKLESKIDTEGDNFEKSYNEPDLGFDHSNSNNKIQLQSQNDYVHDTSPTKVHADNHNEKSPLISSHKLFHNSHMENTTLPCEDNINIDKQRIRQIQHADGSMEYQFPNGNVKKVFPDQGLTRLIYYNGDIRETNKNGKIKYFYASTRTWHTTMPDGLEILEFADGQIEKRSHSGTVEVLFPDGSVRILEVDGTERWTLPDGTLIQILTNGEKILTLPNGQQEIHTKTHKRREYPDGTTKFIYPDGTQETRYSNGRIRVKDKDGNLLMDSYQ